MYTCENKKASKKANNDNLGSLEKKHCQIGHCHSLITDHVQTHTCI